MSENIKDGVVLGIGIAVGMLLVQLVTVAALVGFNLVLTILSRI